MSEQRVEAKKTAPQMRDYAIAALVASEPLLGSFMSKEQVGVLWAQYFTETSAQNCYNWNIGNVKKVAGDGYDYHCLVGTWECFPVSEAQGLIATGAAKLDTNPQHVLTAGAGRLSVLFQPPHPMTRFRSYPSLARAMGHHVQLLQKRFVKAWPYMLLGDPEGFAHGLKLQNYYTASESQYANNMKFSWDRWMRANDFDLAEQTVLAVSDPGVNAATADLDFMSDEALVAHMEDTSSAPENGYEVG